MCQAYLPHAHGKVTKFVCLSFFLSVAKKLRSHDLAPLWISEHIRTFENRPILLTYTYSTTGLTHFDSLHFQLFSYYLVHFGSHFIYGHGSHPQLVCSLEL